MLVVAWPRKQVGLIFSGKAILVDYVTFCPGDLVTTVITLSRLFARSHSLKELLAFDGPIRTGFFSTFRALNLELRETLITVAEAPGASRHLMFGGKMPESVIHEIESLGFRYLHSMSSLRKELLTSAV